MNRSPSDGGQDGPLVWLLCVSMALYLLWLI